MAETTHWGLTGDGYIYATYTDDHTVARDTTTGTALSTGSITSGIGWYPVSKRLYRTYLSFDTSVVTGPVSAATIRLYLDNEWNSPTQGHDIVLMHNDTYPGDVLELTDFKRGYYSGGGAANVKVYTGDDSDYKTFTLNTTGCDWINKSGITSLCLRSVYDVSLSPPNYIWAGFNTANKGGEYRPKLIVEVGAAPAVTTSGSSSITLNSAITYGIVDDEGTTGITEYGFVYNDDYSDPVNLASADNKQTGSDMTGSTGAFSATLSSLSHSTKHQYRAYASNALVTSYGLTGNFTTEAPLSVKTRESSSIGGSTATANGTIVGDGGDGITDHGFIYKASSDPYEEASPISNPTGAAHYVQLGTGSEGTYSHGLTGLTEATPYLIRSYAQTTGGTAYGKLRIFRTGTPIKPIVIGAASDGQIHAATTGANEGERWDRGHDNDGSGGNGCTITLNAAGDSIKVGIGTFSDFWRGYLYFDTSSIPTGATIVKAQVSLYMTARGADTTTKMYVLSGQPTYPHDPLVADDDYDVTNYAGTYGLFLYSALGAGDYYKNAYGFIDISTPDSIVTKGGMTKLCLIMEEDWEDRGEFLDDENSLTFNSANSANPPRLEIFLTGASKECAFYSLPGDGEIHSSTDGNCENYSDPVEEWASEAGFVNIAAADITVAGGYNSVGCPFDWHRINMDRGYLYFDTSSIPSGATIVDASLWIYCTDYDYLSLWDAIVYDGQPNYPSESAGFPALCTGDWAISNYSNIATIPLSDMMYDVNATERSGWAWTTIPITSITKEGLTKFCLRVESTYESDATNKAVFNSGNDAAKKPYLLVNWSSTSAHPPLPQINAGGSMRTSEEALIYTQDQWRLVTKAQINAGGTMRDCTGA